MMSTTATTTSREKRSGQGGRKKQYAYLGAGHLMIASTKYELSWIKLTKKVVGGRKEWEVGEED
jgi:hypothetical protein